MGLRQNLQQYQAAAQHQLGLNQQCAVGLSLGDSTPHASIRGLLLKPARLPNYRVADLMAAIYRRIIEQGTIWP